MKAVNLLFVLILLYTSLYCQEESHIEKTSISEDLKNATFLDAWNYIHTEYWDTTFSGLDWKEVGIVYRSRLEAIKDHEELSSLINNMVGELNVSHIGIINEKDIVEQGSLGLNFKFIDQKVLLTSVNNPELAFSNDITIGDELIRIGSVCVSKYVNNITKIKDYNIDSKVVINNLPLRGRIGDTKSLEFKRMNGVIYTIDLKFENYDQIKDRFINKRIGDYYYSKLKVFDLTYHSVLDSIIPKIKKSKGWIIDLRGNLGGTESFNGSFASWLFPDDGFLGYEKSKNKVSTLFFEFNGKGEDSYSGPVVVLVDEYSASTSEIFADAFSILKRATIVGQRSSGKVFVARIHRLPTGAFLQVPISQYINLNGEPIEGKGVTPDIEVVLSQDILYDSSDPSLEQAIAFLKSLK